MSDSDEELESIGEIDNILREFDDKPFEASHQRIYHLFKHLAKVEEVLDLDSEVMVEAIERSISPQISYFSNSSRVQEIAD